MPTCGGFRIGVLSIEPKTPPLVIVNEPPLRSSSVSVPFCALPANSRMRLLDAGEGQILGVADHRHDEALRRADGDPDVVVVLEHHLLALDLGVETGERAQRRHRRP